MKYKHQNLEESNLQLQFKKGLRSYSGSTWLSVFIKNFKGNTTAVPIHELLLQFIGDVVMQINYNIHVGYIVKFKFHT